MTSIKSRGGSPNHNDKSGDVARIKAGTAATMDELREFMSHMRGKSPQEILGLVADSGLAQGIILSTVATAVVLLVFTVGPYMIYGHKSDQVAAKKEAAKSAAAAAPADDKKEPAAGDKAAAGKGKTETATSEGSSKEQAMKSMTKDFDEVKGQKKDEVPGNIDNLLEID